MARAVRSPYDEGKEWLDSSRAGAAALAGIAPLHQVTVMLDNDQIKALPSVAVTILPPSGENRLYRVSEILLIANVVTVYTNAGTVQLKFGTPEELYCSQSADDAGIFTDDSEPTLSSFSPPVLFNGNYEYVAGFENKPMSIRCTNSAGGNFTGGNAANSFAISVSYLTLNTITGEFE